MTWSNAFEERLIIISETHPEVRTHIRNLLAVEQIRLLAHIVDSLNELVDEHRAVRIANGIENWPRP